MATDIVAKMQQLLKQNYNKSVSIPELLSGMISSQEKGREAGFSCTETAGMLTELIGKQN